MQNRVNIFYDFAERTLPYFRCSYYHFFLSWFLSLFLSLFLLLFCFVNWLFSFSWKQRITKKPMNIKQKCEPCCRQTTVSISPIRNSTGSDRYFCLLFLLFYRTAILAVTDKRYIFLPLCSFRKYVCYFAIISMRWIWSNNYLLFKYKRVRYTVLNKQHNDIDR